MKTMSKLVLALITLGLFVSGVMAQTATTGSISGTITDPTGAAVPGVTATATSPNLILPQSATTGGDGRYTIFSLPPGRYMITVEAQKGFTKASKAISM